MYFKEKLNSLKKLSLSRDIARFLTYLSQNRKTINNTLNSIADFIGFDKDPLKNKAFKFGNAEFKFNNSDEKNLETYNDLQRYLYKIIGILINKKELYQWKDQDTVSYLHIMDTLYCIEQIKNVHELRRFYDYIEKNEEPINRLLHKYSNNFN